MTPKFRALVISRQKAFLLGNLVRYHRLRNSTQRLAAKLRKSYFTSQVEQLRSSDPHQWWSNTKRILKREDPNPLVNLDYLGHPGQLPDYINDFFVSVSAHLPKVDLVILTTLTGDYCADYAVDPVDVEYRLANINIFKAPGPDGIPSWFLWDFAPYLCHPLTAIFNPSIREGYFPPI